jgi:(hydroxyamino)benzene mutase
MCRTFSPKMLLAFRREGMSFQQWGDLVHAQIDLRLARHGAILLLLGMLTGFVIRGFHNRGAGDTAHLVGLMGGYGLIAIGLIWPKLDLGRFWSGAGAWITAVSLYLNWLGVLFLALGSGRNGSAIPGSLTDWITAGQVALKVAVPLSLASAVLILIGLRRLTARGQVH